MPSSPLTLMISFNFQLELQDFIPKGPILACVWRKRLLVITKPFSDTRKNLRVNMNFRYAENFYMRSTKVFIHEVGYIFVTSPREATIILDTSFEVHLVPFQINMKYDYI